MTENLHSASSIASAMPPLLLEAQKVAHTFMKGVHGRRRVGLGETFWQFRHYQPGDASRDIDWRQTAKRDDAFVRQREWEASQTLWLYRDASASMDFSGDRTRRTKKEYAEILLLALGMIALDGGEQVSLLGTDLAPQSHASAIESIYMHLPQQKQLAETARPVSAHAQAVLMSDFFQPVEEVAAFCARLSQRRVGGTLAQVCDPVEETLPYKGRVKFHDIENANAPALTIQQVESVREEYERRFIAHRAALEQVAKSNGWHFMVARTDEAPEAALARLYEHLAVR
jgi:uncharacterized protein (DUF58 family)